MNENDVHIEWNGPMSLEDVEKLTGADDVGIYQIYGRTMPMVRTCCCISARLRSPLVLGFRHMAGNSTNEVLKYASTLDELCRHDATTQIPDQGFLTPSRRCLFMRMAPVTTHRRLLIQTPIIQNSLD